MSYFRQSWPRWILVLTLTSFLGAHWWILQSFTWVIMLGERLAVEPVPMAVTRTFQKQYACKYCKAIDAGRQQERGLTSGLQTKSELSLDMLILPLVTHARWKPLHHVSAAPVLHYQSPVPDLESPPPRSC